MADTTVTAPPSPRRPKRWLRVLLGIVGIFVVLLVVLYFVVCSSAFLKSAILPRVSNSLNADVTVGDASVSPFSEVVFKNVKVQPRGAEPLFTAPELRARYHLMDIIGGNIHVDEVTVSSPTIDYVVHADGTSNLDPITKAQKSGEKKENKPSASPGKPPQIDVKKVSLTDATVRSTLLYKNGAKDVSEISHLTVNLEDLKNGQTGKLLLGADVAMANNPPAPEGKGSLQAKLTGNFVFSLTADLKPASVTGNTRFDVSQATGALAEAASLGTDLDCEVTPTEIKQAALRFRKGATRLGELRVTGPFDAQKNEGHLKVELLAIDRQVLNLVGARKGLDFGSTTINSTNDIVLSKAGASINVSGQLLVNKFQVTQTNQTTPTLDLQAKYDVAVDNSASTALVKDFTLTGMQNGKALLRGELTSPMTVAWGNTSNAVGESALNLAISSLNLADWKPFLGDSVSSGLLNANLKLLSQQAGKLVTFDLDTHLDNLTAGSGTNQITQASITLAAHGKAVDLKNFVLADYKIQLSRQSQSILDVSGSGTYDTDSKAADLQLAMHATIARLLQLVPGTYAAFSSGTIDLTGHITQKQGTQTVTGNLTLADLSGKIGETDLHSFATKIDLDVVRSPQSIQIRKANGTFSEGGNPGGTFDISGTYQTNGPTQITAKLIGFNQNGLRPFLEPMLADKKLVSVALNGSATVQYYPTGDSTVKADLQVTNLVVSDPKQQIPATPLEARIEVDTSLQKNVTDIRQCRLTLTPTARAKNQLQLQGKLDMSAATNYQGNLKLASDGLDVTTYYDLFAGEKQPAAKTPTPAQSRRGNNAPATPASSSPGGAAEKEPDAKQLPFRNFAADIDIAKFFLREVEITGFQGKAKINGGHVLLNPFKLTINGAPAMATVDLDMGIPGYKYDTALNLQSVPLAPLVNSFAPDRKGQVGGTLTAQAKINGAGITGASLQKNLAGQFDVSSTNLNLSVINVKSRVMKALINVVGAIPELLRNPENIAGSLLENVTGTGGGGLTEELKKSPIDAIIAKGVAGSGRVDLSQASVQSPAFRADAKGTVTLAAVLTNSPIQIPVTISLANALGQKVGLIAADAPTNVPYAALPDFYTMRGTIGDPKNDINKVALVKMTAKSLLGALPAGKTNSLLQGLSGILSNPKPASTNTAAGDTNAPATNRAAPLNNLLNDFLKPKKQ